MEKDFTLCTSTKGFGAVSKNNKYVEKIINNYKYVLSISFGNHNTYIKIFYYEQNTAVLLKV